MIAGSANDPSLASRLEACAESDARIVLLIERIPDSRVAELFAASDCSVCAYDSIFSSGALLLSMTLGVPAVTPRAGSGAEIGEQPAIFGFDADICTALRSAMQTHRDSARDGALASAASFPKETFAAAHSDLVHELSD